jgi:hypothetical protein
MRFVVCAHGLFTAAFSSALAHFLDLVFLHTLLIIPPITHLFSRHRRWLASDCRASAKGGQEAKLRPLVAQRRRAAVHEECAEEAAGSSGEGLAQTGVLRAGQSVSQSVKALLSALFCILCSVPLRSSLPLLFCPILLYLYLDYELVAHRLRSDFKATVRRFQSKFAAIV